MWAGPLPVRGPHVVSEGHWASSSKKWLVRESGRPATTHGAFVIMGGRLGLGQGPMCPFTLVLAGHAGIEGTGDAVTPEFLSL